MNTDSDFARFVDLTHQALCFCQGMQAAVATMSAMATARAEAERQAQPTDASIAATRREMGRPRLAGLLTSRPKMTADQRRAAEHAERTRRLGFQNGRFVG